MLGREALWRSAAAASHWSVYIGIVSAGNSEVTLFNNILYVFAYRIEHDTLSSHLQCKKILLDVLTLRLYVPVWFTPTGQLVNWCETAPNKKWKSSRTEKEIGESPPFCNPVKYPPFWPLSVQLILWNVWDADEWITYEMRCGAGKHIDNSWQLIPGLLELAVALWWTTTALHPDNVSPCIEPKGIK